MVGVTSQVQQVAGSVVQGEQAENGRGHRPGSAGSKQRSTEGQAERWSGSQARDQDR
ncbi:unnamed protein product [Staurois parvus]|uniref:Uncharacterized protein n=1 Tax=Staurois parvus TaxID=386267 RepID=A0ABN9FAH0_9NEOB|nr:unnamed protein product [Staurois parvus]